MDHVIVPCVTQIAQAQSNDVYGALYYSPSSFGYGWVIASSAESAERKALTECQEQSGDTCTERITVKNGDWAALANGDG